MRKCNIFTRLRRKLADEQRGAMLAELLITPLIKMLLRKLQFSKVTFYRTFVMK